MRKLNDYITIKEASGLLGVCEMTLRRWDSSGKLKAIRHPINKYRLYKKDALSNILASIEQYKVNTSYGEVTGKQNNKHTQNKKRK